jgi:hypothetical protein
MGKIMEIFLGLIPDWLKERFSLSHLIAVSAPICAFSIIWGYTAEGPELILAACKGTQAALLEYKTGLLTFLSLFFVFFVAARYSNKKFKRESRQVFPESEDFESSTQLPVQTKIVEWYDDGRKKRYIKIENNLPDAIDRIKGQVVFGDGCTTTFTVPFDVSVPIRSRYSYCVMNDFVTDATYGWTSFETFVEEMTTGGETKERLHLYGRHIRRMRLHFVLTHYNYLFSLPFVGKYELTWILELWKRYYRWLRYFPTKPRLYEWFEQPLRYEIAGEALPVYAEQIMLRPRPLALEPCAALAHEVLSVNYCVYSSVLKGAWSARARIRRRLWVHVRRKFNQLIALTTVCAAGGFVGLSLVSLFLFIWKLALLWGGVIKYGLLVALKLQ